MNSTTNGNASSSGLVKKVIQFVLILGTLMFAFFIVALVWIFYILPSPSELESTFYKETQMADQSRPLQEGDLSVPALDEKPAQIGGDESKSTSANKNKQSGRDLDLILQALSDQRDGLSKACEAIEKGNPTIFSKPNPEKNFNQSLIESFKTGNLDPGMESVLPVLRYLFSFSSVQDLIATVRAAEGQEEDFIKKAEFYSEIYKAYSELESNKAHMEDILDRSYLLFMMAEVAEKNPLVMQTPEALSYCRQIEKAMNEGLAFQPHIEGQEFLKFLDSAQIKPEEIGYDHKQKTQLSLVFSDQGIQVKDTWLDQVFGNSTKPPADQKSQ